MRLRRNTIKILTDAGLSKPSRSFLHSARETGVRVFAKYRYIVLIEGSMTKIPLEILFEFGKWDLIFSEVISDLVQLFLPFTSVRSHVTISTNGPRTPPLTKSPLKEGCLRGSRSKILQDTQKKSTRFARKILKTSLCARNSTKFSSRFARKGLPLKTL